MYSDNFLIVYYTVAGDVLVAPVSGKQKKDLLLIDVVFKFGRYRANGFL